MRISKKRAIVTFLVALLGITFIIAPRYVFISVKQYMNTYEDVQEALKEDHWIYNDKGRKFVYHDGVTIKNSWHEIDNNKYYFDEDGYMKTGWVDDKGRLYYLNEAGLPGKGWIKDSDTWYYLSDAGTPKTGWQKDNGKWYYLNGDGAMQTGWVLVDYIYYYLNNSGAMQTGWLEDKGKTYYLNSNGSMLVGWLEQDDGWSYFGENGAMMTGWIVADGDEYFIDDDGLMVTNKWTTKDDIRCFLGKDGKVSTGWFTADGTLYYYNDDGTPGKDWMKRDGKWYYLNSDGTAHIGWTTINNKSYYFAGNGTMVTGWQTIGGKSYYFKNNGTMATGWITLKEKYYYLNKDGSMAVGWITVDGKDYYMKENGEWVPNKKKEVPDKKTGTGPMVALTFDDGPGPYTDRILNTLQANGAKATFFMQGQNVGNYPDTVRKMANQGCEVANHTYAHQNLTTLDAAGIQQAVSSANNSISSVVGHGASLLRPPYGAYNSTTKANAGAPLILWSIDTLDWKTRDAQKTYDAVMQAKDGDIVLMHDIHAATADAVDMIIPALKEKGYQLVTVSELAAAKGVSLSNGSSYGAIR